MRPIANKMVAAKTGKGPEPQKSPVKKAKPKVIPKNRAVSFFMSFVFDCFLFSEAQIIELWQYPDVIVVCRSSV